MDRRTQWAEQAARLMAEGQGLDCESAKRKAAAKIGCVPGRDEPSCDEVEEQLRGYQHLFRPHQPKVLRRLRQEAVKAMRFLKDFEPRLVGSVLSGTADHNSPITLHLFADTPEQVMFHLLNANMPFREGQRNLRYRDGSVRSYPLFSFLAGGQAVDLVVMPRTALRAWPGGYGGGGARQRARRRHGERRLPARGDGAGRAGQQAAGGTAGLRG
ncbi:MAG: hypothetical protein P3W87_002530, partial [Gammaproteobacteria bacterium]|nr:hypothetical protein [Gammaproteobacteria bacterium]